VSGAAQTAFARLTVAGVGLIGGSLAAATRAGRVAGEVLGFGRSERSLETARTRGLVDRVTRDAREAAAADVIVLAAPLAACAGIAAALAPHARPGTVLTDVGSVKAVPLAELEAAWARVGPVVGAHPIAGAETAGPGAARADLFRGRVCILTPTPTTDAAALARVRSLWEAVGARVEEMPATVHDELLARVSHLPHLVAWALVGVAGRARPAGGDPLDYAGSGFRDTTRIAASPATLWAEILLANRAPLARGLAELRAELAELERLVAAGDADALARALEAARALRLRLEER
jgi:prephenate dehydrogenase